mmetsp:Transcript_9153/g.20993  ORF Transcript_9153/g.20993 Transcript_9153/m.20993 type:complete len:554 (-) Transcript_9153:83-1744(-)
MAAGSSSASTDISSPASSQKGQRQNMSSTKSQQNPAANGSDHPLVEEEVADLQLPSPVPEPDEAEHLEAVKAIRESNEAKEKTLVQLDEEIEQYKAKRGAFNAEINEVRNELRSHREILREVAKEREKLMEEVKKLQDRNKLNEARVQKMRKELRSVDVMEIDQMIADLNTKLETSTNDLKTEKEIIREIKKLTGDKERIKEWKAERDAVAEKKKEIDDLYNLRKSKTENFNALREKEKELVARLESLRSGDGVPDGVNPSQKVTELLGEKAKVIEEIKANRQSINNAHVSFKIKMAEYREYKRALTSYERKVEKVEYRKRQAERAAKADKVKEERKQRAQQKQEERKLMDKRMAAIAAGCQLFVGGLAIRCTEEDLSSYFKDYGTITDVYLIRDNDTKLSRGFGFVTFSDKDSAHDALKKLNGKENKSLCPLHGKLSIRIAEKSKTQIDWEKHRAVQSKKAGLAKQSSTATSGQEDGNQDEEKDMNESQPASNDLDEETETDDQNGYSEDTASPESNHSGGKAKKEWKATRTEWTNGTQENSCTDQVVTPCS